MAIIEKSLSDTLNARIIGSCDETLILAHDFGGDQSMWDKIVPHLTEKYRVVLFDWSYVGKVSQSLFDPIKYSTFEGFADDLIHLLEEMKVTSSVFVGHSMSGMVGLYASIKRPDLFKRLILIGASPRYTNTDDYEGGFPSTGIDQLLAGIESNFNQWASDTASALIDENDPDSVEKFRRTLQTMSPDAALVVAKLIFQGDQRHILEKVTIPCTLVHTTNDAAVPVSVGHYIQKMIKGESTVEIIDADGHFPHLTAHIQVLEIMGRVLGCDLISN